MNTKKYKKAPISSEVQKVNSPLSLSQQKLAMLTSMENEISSIKVALNRIEASIRELQL